MAEPGQLAFRIVTGCLLELFGAGIQRGCALKIREELLITDGLRCRAERLAVLPDVLSFLQDAGILHFVHPQVDAAVKIGAVREVQPENKAAVGAFRRQGIRLLLTEFFAGGAIVFQRTQHPHLIVGMDGVGGFRVSLFQLLVHGSAAFFRQLCRQLLPQTGRSLFFRKADTI